MDCYHQHRILSEQTQSRDKYNRDNGTSTNSRYHNNGYGSGKSVGQISVKLIDARYIVATKPTLEVMSIYRLCNVLSLLFFK